MTQQLADLSGSGDEVCDDAVESRPDLLPLTPAQRGMWFADRLSPDYSVNIAQYLDIRHEPGGLDVDLLMECSYAVGRELETPYIRLAEVDGVPMQYVDVDYDQTIDLYDFRDREDPFGEALAWMRAEYRTTVDLLDDPLIVIAIIKVADDRTLWYQRAHHLIIDGYAALNNMRRVLGRYNALRRGEVAESKPAATLAEIVEQENAYRASSRRETDRAHWAERARDLPERVTLARAKAAAPLSFDNVVAGGTLPAAQQERIDALARELNTSVAVLLSAAFGAYLARMTDSDDVVLSLPVSGRASAKAKRSGGMVSNILPIRMRKVREQTVRQLLGAMQVELLGALRYQRYRTEDIRRDAGMDTSSLTFGPSVNMVFFDEPLTLDGATIDYRILTSGILEDLLINLYQADAQSPLVVDLHGNPNSYSQAEITDHHRRFLSFLEAFLGDLDRSVGDLDLMQPGEVAGIQGHESGSEVPGLGSDLLADLAGHAAATPHAVALVAGEREVSYAEFAARVAVLGRRLIAAGVGPDVAVALCIPRSVEMMVAIHAILAAGGQYVPIDTAAPADRAAYMMTTAGARVLLVGRESDALGGTAAAATAAVPVWTVDADDDVDLSTPPIGDAERGRVHPDAAAYTLFTSGSTGTPKGVVLSHRALLNRLRWGIGELGLTAGDRVMQKTPYTFDCSVPELFAPFLVGATVVVLKDRGHIDPLYVCAEIERTRSTMVHFVPSMLSVFLEAAGADRVSALDSVRVVSTTGEALPPAVAAEVRRRWPHADLYNLYGPTEAAVEITSERIVDIAPDDPSVPIGRPIWNSSARVLDAQLRRVPAGVPGELYLGGVQVARGYAARPDLSAERFVADPYGFPGERMYRTGDLVRRMPDGRLEYLGRTDFQIKLRGQRIELGEIESVIAGIHGVVHTAVTVAAGPGGAEHLVAYLCGPPGETVDLHAVKGEVAKVLPGYMVPSVWTVLDAIPLNTAGKVDRKALPAPDFRQADREYVAPRTPAEVAVVGVLQGMLQADRIGVGDSIFDLGADSLTAARLQARLRAESWELSLADVFASQSVADLAAAAVPVDPAAAAVGALTLAPRVRPGVIPVSEVQRGMWLLNRTDPDSPAYNSAFALRLSGDLDPELVKSSVADLVERQIALRTYYPMVDGDPVQRVVPAAEVLAHLDLDPVDAVDAPLAVVENIVGRGFDVTSRPPIRMGLLKTGEREHVVVFVIHHISTDGSSLKPLALDFLASATARAEGRPPAMPPLSVDYLDFTLWQRERLAAVDGDGVSERDRQLDYWTKRLAGAPEQLRLPTDRRRPPAPSFAGASVEFKIPATLVQRLESVARSANATLFDVVHGAYAVLLGRMAGASDLVIGTAYAGRTVPALDDLVGMFVNSLPLRTRLHHDEPFEDLLRRVHADGLADMANADVAFESVVEATGIRRSSAVNPVFQAMLLFQNFEFPVVELPGLTIALVDEGPVTAQVDLQLVMYPTDPLQLGAKVAGAPMRAVLVYATDLFDAETVERYSERFLAVLDAIAVDPTMAVGDITIATGAELTAAAFDDDDPAPVPLTDFVADRAAAEPDRVAVAYGGSSVTFGDLAAMTAVMAASLPDADAALMTALMSLVPALVDASPAALSEVLASMRAVGA